MRTLLSILIVLSVLPVYAQEDEPRLSRKNVKFPVITGEVPQPEVTNELSSDALYVIESDVKVLVISSRTGMVSITPETAPIKIRGKFADGHKSETRSYSTGYVYIVEVIQAGSVELIVIPPNTTEESMVLRRLLHLKGPQPPPPYPTPPTPPLPPVPPPPVPPTTPVPNLFGLDVVVRNATRSIPPDKRIFALKLADAYRDGAKKLVDPNSGWTVTNVIEKQRDYNKTIAGYDGTIWTPVFVAIANELGEHRAAGRFSTKEHYVAAWAELSLAFSGAAQ
jgi:hypothetical protein